MKTQTVDLPDGTRTAVEWFDVEQTPEKATVAFLPALGVDVGFYRNMARDWARLGVRVATIELRGRKQSSVRDVRSCNFGYNEVLNVDLATILPRIKREAAGKPLVLAGHSLGAQLALLYASRDSGVADGIISFAGGSNYYGAMPPGQRLKRQIGIRAVRLIDQALGFFPGDKLGFGGRQPLNMILDWTHEALTGKYSVIGDPTSYDDALSRLSLPVLLISLSGDPLVPRTSATFLAGKLKQARITQIELKASDYGLKRFDHFRWARNAAPVLAKADAWMDRELHRRV